MFTWDSNRDEGDGLFENLYLEDPRDISWTSVIRQVIYLNEEITQLQTQMKDLYSDLAGVHWSSVLYQDIWESLGELSINDFNANSFFATLIININLKLRLGAVSNEDHALDVKTNIATLLNLIGEPNHGFNVYAILNNFVKSAKEQNELLLLKIEKNLKITRDNKAELQNIGEHILDQIRTLSRNPLNLLAGIILAYSSTEFRKALENIKEFCE